MKVLVTGANRGLGLEFVTQLSKRGNRVFATCRVPTKAHQLMYLQEQHPDQISVTALDVTDPRSISQSHNEIIEHTESLDLLVNNAGIDVDDGGLGDFNPATMQSILTVNTIGPILCIQQYLNLLKAGNHPKIVNISSRWGSLASLTSPGPSTYSASKAALNMYTRCLSHTLHDTGVTVIALSPGWVQTDMGGPNADITPDISIRSMLQFIERINLEQSGGFFDYMGREIPW